MRGELDKLLTCIDISLMMITHDPQDLAWFGEQAVHLRDGGAAAVGARGFGGGVAEPGMSSPLMPVQAGRRRRITVA